MNWSISARSVGIVGVVEADQALIARVFCLIAPGIFLDDLLINRLRFLQVTELALAVPGQQHHFGSHFLGHLILAPLIIGQRLRVLAA